MGITFAIFQESGKVLYHIDRLKIYVNCSDRMRIVSLNIRGDIPSIAEDLVMLMSFANLIT